MGSSGAQLIAQTLKSLGIDTVFGLVGIPVVDVADECIKLNIKFISFRNEQAASYAASLYGYLTGRPGVLLVVGGPGLVHACAGIFNSQLNRWPLLVLAGSTSGAETYRGGFQELDQVSYLAPNVKFSARPREVSQLPFLILKALKTALVGVPGVAYVDLPADFIEATDLDIQSLVSPNLINASIMANDAPKFVADPAKIHEAAQIIKSAKSPLVIIGKGASYSNCSAIVTNFVESHNLPFLPTPMGKGVVDDRSELNISSARSAALKSSDVIILLGARLNWILHHGDAPKYRDDVKFIQLDISSEDIGDNGAGPSYSTGLVGDIGLTLKELHKNLDGYHYPKVSDSLIASRDKNATSLGRKELLSSNSDLLNYNQVYKLVRDLFELYKERMVYVIEGANTMDIARISFESYLPKTRLDAGTNATMGVGIGYLIAAKVAFPQKLVLAIEGDSAFGFSAMELETIARFKLPVIVIVMNNSGVYHGVNPSDYQTKNSYQLPSTALGHDVKYDLLAESLGIEGLQCSTAEGITNSLQKAIANYEDGKATLLNIIIQPGTSKKLEFGWRNKKKSNAKL